MRFCEKPFPDDNSRNPCPIAFKFDMAINITKTMCPIVFGGNPIFKMAATCNFVKKPFPDDNSRSPCPIAFKFDMAINITKTMCPIVFGGNPRSKMAATCDFVKNRFRMITKKILARLLSNLIWPLISLSPCALLFLEKIRDTRWPPHAIL